MSDKGTCFMCARRAHVLYVNIRPELFVRYRVHSRRKFGIAAASERGVISGVMVVEGPEVNIPGGHIDVGVSAVGNREGIGAVRSHADQLRRGGVILLVINESAAYVKAIHPVVGQHLDHPLGQGVAAESVILGYIQVVDIVI